MLLSGNLSNWSVTDLLQIMRVTAKTATLRVDGERAGLIHFSDGRIVGAALAGQRIPSTTEEALRSTVDALHVLTGFGDGAFLVAEPQFDSALPGWEVTELMTEVERLRQLQSEVRSSGVESQTLLRLSTEAATPLSLHAEEWQAMVALVPAFSLSSLEAIFGNSHSLQIVSALLNRGLTSIVPLDLPEPEIEPGPESLELTEALVGVDELNWLGDHHAEGPLDLEPSYAAAEAFEESNEQGSESERRSARGVAASPETTLVSGVLGDMRKLRTGP
ncbi:MAG: DUF4388 domain-containing protein [Acidimicrobiia bacterium]